MQYILLYYMILSHFGSQKKKITKYGQSVSEYTNKLKYTPFGIYCSGSAFQILVLVSFILGSLPNLQWIWLPTATFWDWDGDWISLDIWTKKKPSKCTQPYSLLGTSFYRFHRWVVHCARFSFLPISCYGVNPNLGYYASYQSSGTGRLYLIGFHVHCFGPSLTFDNSCTTLSLYQN